MPRVAAESQVPYEVQVALVDACGKVFWYWEDYRHFLRKAGVHPAVVQRVTNAGLSKYQVMREVLSELDAAGQPGMRVQLQLVRALIALPLTAHDGLDPAEAKSAQAALRAVSDEHGLLPETKSARRQAEERLAAQQRRRQAQRREAERSEAEAARQALFREFCELLSQDGDRQGRGYRLEAMLCELAALEGLRHSGPYRKGTVTQTDGMVTFEGFQYLVEARWRADPADVGQVAALAHKAERSLHSTRALFVSMAGFRPEVVDELERGTKNLLLMSGTEFSLILEGRVTLARALQLKVDEGAKKGRIFFDLAQVPTL
jgi:hypothetical protein